MQKSENAIGYIFFKRVFPASTLPPLLKQTHRLLQSTYQQPTTKTVRAKIEPCNEKESTAFADDTLRQNESNIDEKINFL